jgi:hypothetical protein
MENPRDPRHYAELLLEAIENGDIDHGDAVVKALRSDGIDTEEIPFPVTLAHLLYAAARRA